MNTFIKDLPAPIVIVGLGKSGEAAHKFLLLAGRNPNEIITFDSKSPVAQFNDPEQLVKEIAPKTLVVSPGVPLSSHWIQDLKKRGVLITSEISLACSVLQNERIIGVTGSLGKSTTVSLLGAGLRSFIPHAFVGGNLGVPFVQYAIDVTEGKVPRSDWIVLELSSYQLENCKGLNLALSAITYLAPNHLERYASLEEYYETKWSILGLTTDLVFLNSQGGDLTSFLKQHPSHKVRVVSRSDSNLGSLSLNESKLIGGHNQDNLALAASIAQRAGWPEACFAGMKEFGGLSHRLENLGTIRDVLFINDSKATAMDSVLTAAVGVQETRKNQGQIYLLLGGRNKSLPWNELHTLKKYKEFKFVFFGECREIAKEKSQLEGPQFEKLGPALDYVLNSVQAQDTVLLSPGGTSLDEFRSFEDRGDFFKSRVNLFADRNN